MPRRLAECRREWNSDNNKDVVIFHIFRRPALSPSNSPFVLKLETFLRMHDVKYKVDHNFPANPVTRKSPWITFNGEDIADSQAIMEFLSEKLSLVPKYDLDANPKDKVVARGLRSILEDHFYFCMLSIRMIHGKYEDIATVFPTMVPVKMVQKFIVQRIMKTIGDQSKAQGIGRYPKDEVLKMANEDLEILSLALGDQNFIMGDEPSELDCALFAFLALNLDDFLRKPKNVEETFKQTKEGEESGVQKLGEYVADVDDKYKNLQEYISRMKERLWGDWDDLCKEAEKELAKKDKAINSKEKEAEDTENAKQTNEDEKKKAREQS